MDAFTENLLSRARERQKLLEDYNSDGRKQTTASEPNLNRNVPVHSPLKSHSEDNVRVEVQIEEQHESSDGDECENSGLRQDAKNRLNRLGKLYAGGDDADISSPIHQTEGRFYAGDSPKVPKGDNAKSKRGLSKLADLAQSYNQFEDDLSSVRKEKDETTVKPKKWCKPPAPQPPAPQPPAPQPPQQKSAATPTKPSTKPKAPNPPTIVKETPKKDKNVAWDKKVLDSLESQGFTRTDSSTRIIYKYDSNREKENISDEKPEPEETKPAPASPQRHVRAAAIADKAALFESSPNRTQKDPALLSVSERKALFEKNKGTALIPKAPFAMATPIKDGKENGKSGAVAQINKVKVDVKPLSPKKENVKPLSPKKENVKPLSPRKEESTAFKVGGIANKVAALFENKSTISQEQIENSVREQRKKEMDMLLNRFHKPVEMVPEEDEFDDDATEETVMIDTKPAAVVTSTSSKEERRSSGNKRCSKADSPKVAAVLSDVKRIKVSQKSGRLYPSLTDIETETENETRSPTPNGEHSSSENSIAESDVANTSFGRDILEAVCKNQTPQKRVMPEDSGSDLSDVLDDMDDYIDEALAYNGGQSEGPTPPKQGRKSPIEPSHSFNYKSFQSNSSEFKSPVKKPATSSPGDLPTHVVDGDNVLPLTHTVSFYRKQQSQATTPIRQISRQALIIEESPEQRNEEEELIRSKITELKNEIGKQEMIISQTSQALNLCNATPEFMGSTEQVEAERVLLLATHRRQAAMHEKQRLEVEKTLRPQRKDQMLPQKGNLTISKIILPLKQKYVTALAAAGGKGHHVVCLIKYADQVLPTQLVSTVASSSKNLELELNIPGTYTIKNVYSDFTITFEVYCLQAQEEILPHEVKYHIKKPSTKLTPKKSKQDSRLIYPLKESPAGPQVVRSPTFALMGYVVFSMQAVNKKHWSLNNTPPMSPLEGTVEMCVRCELTVSVEHRGFLTMFEDVSGFGAWHRRWCLLKDDTLSYWKYPDDEKKTPPINSIDLKESTTKHVGPVSRDICARLHTFLIETEREARPHDKDSLVTVRQGARTVIRHLLSADTKEERIEWCNKFNAALNMWGKSRD